MHESVVDLIQKATRLMDQFLRYRIDVDEYTESLRTLNVEEILVSHEEDFKKNADLVHYLDALMLLSSLQHELEFQVAEYGSNVALEDMRTLEDLLRKVTQD
jgi:hypothetical protein